MTIVSNFPAKGERLGHPDIAVISFACKTIFMTAFARAMEFFFIGFWLLGVVSWLYAARYFLPMWADRFRENPQHKGYPRKALIGITAFLLAILFAFAAGGLAEWGGGWS